MQFGIEDGGWKTIKSRRKIKIRKRFSIPLNIAEGNGKYGVKDRCRFFDIAHGSALECTSGLDILVAKGKLTAEQIRPGKERLQRIVRMLMGLIKRNSTRDYYKGEADNEAPSDS